MLRVNWDQYETAKLIEVYWKIHCNPASRKKELEILSDLLRKYGSDRGYIVDEKYRNCNGVALQLSYIEGIFSDGQRGLMGATALFCSMATMYSNDRHQFDAILSEANRRMHVITDDKTLLLNESTGEETLPMEYGDNSVEVAFFAYMESKSKFTRDEAATLLKKAAAYCRYKGTLLGEMDVAIIRDAQQKIAAGIMLRFRYGKKEAKRIRDIIDLYYAFVKSYRKPMNVLEPEHILSKQREEHMLAGEESERPVLEDSQEKIQNPVAMDVPSSQVVTTDEHWQSGHVLCEPVAAYDVQHESASAGDRGSKVTIVAAIPEATQCGIEIDIAQAEKRSAPEMDQTGSHPVEVSLVVEEPVTDAIEADVSEASDEAEGASEFLSDGPQQFVPSLAPFSDAGIVVPVNKTEKMPETGCQPAEIALVETLVADVVEEASESASETHAQLVLSCEPPSDSVIAAFTSTTQVQSEWILTKLRSMNLRHQDKRSLGGCLWVAGGHELDALMTECATRGYRLYYKAEGCNTFPNTPVWWTKDCVIEQQQPAMPIRLLTSTEAQMLDSFSKWLAEDQHLAPATVNSYRSAVKVSAEVILENGLPVTLLQADVASAQQAVDALMARRDFAEKNRGQNNRYSAALARYIQFVGDARPAVVAPTIEVPVQEDAAPWAMYEAVLLQGFPKGFQKESGLDLRKFLKRWEEVHGEKLVDSDETIRRQIASHCVDTGKRWYLSEQLLSEGDRAIVLDYIENVLASGKTVLFYASIYTVLEPELESTVLTADLLAKYLQATLKGKYYLFDRYLAIDAHARVDVADEIREAMAAYGKPIHTNDLRERLHHLPGEQVERELHLHREFIMDAFHMYFHEAMIELSEQEKDGIAAFIQGKLDEQGYMISNSLYQDLKQLNPEVIERMSCLSELGVRGVIAYKLQDRFTFTDAVITPKGTAMNMIDIFAMYCKRNTPFSLDDLTAFAGECGVVIYWDTVHKNCVRINEESFVASSDVHWDTQRIDAAIGLSCPGNYVVLQKIQYFDAFPHIGYPWNNYLLEQYVATASEQFDLMHSSYAKEKTSGVIVRKSAGYDCFDDVLADLLADAPVTLERGPCLDYLAEQGCITRKRLGTIAEIIARAKLLRAQKG